MAKEALAAQAELFHQAEGGGVERIAGGDHPVQAERAEGEIQHGAGRFAHQALAPEIAPQAPADLGGAGFRIAQAKADCPGGHTGVLDGQVDSQARPIGLGGQGPLEKDGGILGCVRYPTA